MDFKKNYLSKQEIETIGDALNSERDRLMHKILKWTGRRITEALSLKPMDIDHERKKINFIQLKKRNKIGEDEAGKSITERKKVVIPVDCNAFYQELIDYIQKNEIKNDEYVFFSPYKGRDHHITKRRIEQIYMETGAECGIKVIPHFLRHSFAIQLLDYMINVIKKDDLQALVNVKGIMGHTSIDTTLGYLAYVSEETGLQNIWDKKLKKEENGG